LSLFYNGRRIPEPFCIVDMGIPTGSDIIIQLAEGAVVGHDALRQQVLDEIAAEAEEAARAGDTGGMPNEEEK